MKRTHASRGTSSLRAAGAALGLAALAAATPVQAQFLSIEAGQTVKNSLSTIDPVPSTRGPFKVYEFQARRGDRLTATMRSAAFDAYLRLVHNVGGITDEVDNDDDGGGDTAARMRFTVPDDGTYLLVAQALEEEGSGAFTLALETTAAPTTAQVRPIRLGQTVTGELAETDAISEDDDTYYDSWTVDVREGQRLVVVMESGAFDAFLSFGRTESDGTFGSDGSNDDGDQNGDSTNARLRVKVGETGTWEIRANSVGTATGPYRLTVFEGPTPPATAAQQAIVGGEEMRGRLDEADAVLDDESYHEYWMYQGRAGEQLVIRMASEDFDTSLAIGRMAKTGFEEISSNDDGPDGTDSEIEITLPANATYAIRANTLGAGLVGDYTVIVTRAR